MEIGVLSDWVMVVITAITAYFLYKTLKSQKDVQKTQNDLYRIENIRFKESIKPRLKCKSTTDVFHPSGGKQKILTVKIHCEAGEARKISIPLSETSKQIFIPTGISENRNYLAKGDDPLVHNFLLKDSRDWAIFELRYEDVAGYKYKQRIVCMCYDSDIDVYMNLPEEIIED